MLLQVKAWTMGRVWALLWSLSISTGWANAYRIPSAWLSYRRSYDMQVATDDSLVAQLPKKLPVTVLSGFLGAGKTTLLQQILRKKDVQRKYAVIVNDMAELNIDGGLISPHIKQAEEKLVEMSNGCICCTLREDLLHEITQLSLSKQFDHLIIESTGISEPLPVAETFLFAPQLNDSTTLPFQETGAKSLSDLAEIDSMVTVVDCKHFLQDMASADELKARNLTIEETDFRSVTDLLVQQVEFATVIVLNKCDLVTPTELLQVKQYVRALNRDAKVLETSFGDIDLDEIIGARGYDFNVVSQSATWIKAMSGQSSLQQSAKRHTSEAEEYGISSFVYRARRPFDPKRLLAFVENHLDPFSGAAADGGSSTGRILRSKGFFWLASRLTQSLLWAQAGGQFSLSPGGHWRYYEKLFEGLDEDEEDSEEQVPSIEESDADWIPDLGDRRQEIVFIGLSLQPAHITSLLDACLISAADWQSIAEQEASTTQVMIDQYLAQKQRPPQSSLDLSTEDYVDFAENPLDLEDDFPVFTEEDGPAVTAGGDYEATDGEVEVEIVTHRHA